MREEEAIDALPDATVPLLRNNFNTYRDCARVVTLLSPTSGPCLWGYGVVRDLFARRPAVRMIGMAVWVPMLDSDTPVAAEQQSTSWQDDRVNHWWDRTTQVSHAFQQTLGLQGPAWDLYLLDGPAAHWEEDLPPPPAFWMHQLSEPGADPAVLLCQEPDRLSHELDMLKQE